MDRIALEAWGSAKKLGVPTVTMVTGTGGIRNKRFCLTSECCSEREIDEEANLLTAEIEEWRKVAKRELKKRKRRTE